MRDCTWTVRGHPPIFSRSTYIATSNLPFARCCRNLFLPVASGVFRRAWATIPAFVMPTKNRILEGILAKMHSACRTCLYWYPFRRLKHPGLCVVHGWFFCCFVLSGVLDKEVFCVVRHSWVFKPHTSPSSQPSMLKNLLLREISQAHHCSVKRLLELNFIKHSKALGLPISSTTEFHKNCWMTFWKRSENCLPFPLERKIRLVLTSDLSGRFALEPGHTRDFGRVRELP